MKQVRKPNILAHWKETGAWWEGEIPTERVVYLDQEGVRRERVRELDPLLPRPDDPLLQRKQQDVQERAKVDQRDEWNLRPRKIRDEKVGRATGAVEHPTETMRRVVNQVRDLRESYRDEWSGEKRPFVVHSETKATGANASCRYVPLHVVSGYAFGRSTLFAEEIPRAAAAFGLPAVAIADPFSLVGAVEFALEAKRHGVKPLIGATIVMPEGGEIVLIARSKSGYSCLSQLITECHLGEPRLFPLCTWERLGKHARELICLSGGHRGAINRHLAAREYASASDYLSKLTSIFGVRNVYLELERSFVPWEVVTNTRLMHLSQTSGVAIVASGEVNHLERSHFPAQDMLACIESLCSVSDIIGRKPTRDRMQPQVPAFPCRDLNAEKFFRSPNEMLHLYRDVPHAVDTTLSIAESCDDDVLPERTQLPAYCQNPAFMLREVTMQGAIRRHKKLSHGLRVRIDSELERIIRLNFSTHFLIAWDICRWATDNQILHSGRGSVVDSAVAYCLGLSRIDAWEHRLHFDRFLPESGGKRPDIDIDFEAKKRNDVRAYATNKYGREHVATVAAIGAFCSRGIIREVGKALQIPPNVSEYLAKRLHGGVTPYHLEAAISERPELKNSGIPKERFEWVFRLANSLADIPRNMRAHSSGVVISHAPLSHTVPVMQSAGGSEDSDEDAREVRIIQWDKRSCKHYFDKFDLLCLRGQDVLSGTQELIHATDRKFQVVDVPLEDQDTYRAMRSGELIGVPQSASPAMRQAHIRLRTENLSDASLVQAGIRPGVGGAVKINELIARRRGVKPYSFDHPIFEEILGNTYGIIVFQEQVDQLLQSFCGYTSDEAEDIRDKIHKRRREDYGEVIKDELIKKIVHNGFNQQIANQVFELVAGFKGYGFAQGHALAFAEISIRSIYCQQNYPAQYFASLLSAQPAGYYGPITLANEARLRGVKPLPVCINSSDHLFSVEDVKSQQDPKIILPSAGVRTGLIQVSGLGAATIRRIIEKRNDCSEKNRYSSFEEFIKLVRPNRDELEQLIFAGAFDSLFSNRRALLWAVAPMLEGLACASPDPRSQQLIEVPLPRIDNTIADFSEPEKAVHERRVLGMDVDQHLMSYERTVVHAKGGLSAQQAKLLKDGEKAFVVGNPIRLRFPPTPSGKRVVFFDLEDETGLLNVTCFDDAYRRDGQALVCNAYVTVVGRAQDRDGHTAFLATRVFPYRPKLAEIVDEGTELPLSMADFLVG